VGKGHRHHPAGHREHSGHRNRVTDGDQQGGHHSGPGSESCLDIGQEAPRRRLDPGELRHRERQKDHGDPSGHDGQGSRDVGGDDDHAEGEVEIDARSDVGNGRDRQIYGAELP
jgi:hypothetical protein